METATKICTLDALDFTSARVLDSRLFPPDELIESFGWMLVGRVAPHAPRTVKRISASPFRVGRNELDDLPVPSRNVSKKHAEFVVAGDAIFVRDLGSTNGTTVNGRRIRGEIATPVGVNDVVRFADVEFRIGRDERPDDAM